MIPIKIDTSTLFEDFALFNRENSKALISFVVKEITVKFASEWGKQAESNLKSSRNQYIRSIVIVNSPNPQIGIIELVGVLPNMVENGVSPFDMKEGFLKGRKAKIGKGGARYNTIPFTFGNPQALEENFSNILPQPVYKALLSKEQNINIIGGTASRLTGSDIPVPYDKKISKTIYVPQSQSYEKYTHKTSIYEGVTRQKSSVTNQNSYVSFRRVSDNSDPKSWIHQGIERYNLAELALEEINIPFEVGKNIDIYLTKNGFR